MVYLLHHSLVADAHRPEFGPVGHPGNLAFIEADGSLRKGQVVIPTKVRDLLDIREGDRLPFTQEGDKVILQFVKKRSVLDAVGLIKINKEVVYVDKLRDQVRKDVINNDIKRQQKEV